MDPVTLAIVAVLAFEAMSGGYGTATVVGGATGAVKAASGEAKKGAASWYAKREKRLKKTWLGRRRLAGEKTLAGLVAFLGRGVAAGVRAVPEGARSGRQWRTDHGGRSGVAYARDGVEWVRDRMSLQRLAAYQREGRCGYPIAKGKVCGKAAGNESFGGYLFCPEHLADLKAGDPDAVTDPHVADPVLSLCPTCGQPPSTNPDCPTCQAVVDDHMQAAAETACCDVWVATGMRDQHAEDCPHRVAMDDLRAGRRDPADPALAATNETTPATGGGDKEEQMSDLSDVAEDKGAEPYVNAWDGEIGGLERILGQVTEVMNRVSVASEKNARHEVGGAPDVVGALQTAVDALTSAGERIETHAGALHTAHDAAIGATKGSDVTSHQEYVGAH